LKPILHGLVSEESLASFIVGLIPERRNDPLKKLLFEILKRYGGVDVSAFKRAGQNRTLWEEISKINSSRNKVVHEAAKAEPGEAELAIDVAKAVLRELFPSVISKTGLHTHERLWVCGKKH